MGVGGYLKINIPLQKFIQFSFLSMFLLEMIPKIVEPPKDLSVGSTMIIHAIVANGAGSATTAASLVNRVHMSVPIVCGGETLGLSLAADHTTPEWFCVLHLVFPSIAAGEEKGQEPGKTQNQLCTTA